MEGRNLLQKVRELIVYKSRELSSPPHSQHVAWPLPFTWFPIRNRMHLTL